MNNLAKYQEIALPSDIWFMVITYINNPETLVNLLRMNKTMYNMVINSSGWFVKKTIFNIYPFKGMKETPILKLLRRVILFNTRSLSKDTLNKDCIIEAYASKWRNSWIQKNDSFGWDQKARIHNFSDNHIFKANHVLQRSSCKKFKCFALGCESPSGYENPSYTTISIYGVEIGDSGNSCYHLINFERFKMREEDDMKEIVYDTQERFYNKISKLDFVNWSKLKCFNWIDLFMHHGYGINELYKSDFELSGICKVMKASQWNHKTNNFMCHGTVLCSKYIVHQYINFMSVLIDEKRLSIHKDFFTSHNRGKDFVIRELQRQIMNLRRNLSKSPHGKITAKTKREDFVYSLIMVPYIMDRSIKPNSHAYEISEIERNKNANLNLQFLFFK